MTESKIVELSDKYADLKYGLSQTYELVQKIIEAYAEDFKNELDALVLENYNSNEDLARIVGDPQEWKHKQKKRPWD